MGEKAGYDRLDDSISICYLFARKDYREAVQFDGQKPALEFAVDIPFEADTEQIGVNPKVFHPKEI